MYQNKIIFQNSSSNRNITSNNSPWRKNSFAKLRKLEKRLLWLNITEKQEHSYWRWLKEEFYVKMFLKLWKLSMSIVSDFPSQFSNMVELEHSRLQFLCARLDPLWDGLPDSLAMLTSVAFSDIVCKSWTRPYSFQCENINTKW